MFKYGNRNVCGRVCGSSNSVCKEKTDIVSSIIRFLFIKSFTQRQVFPLVNISPSLHFSVTI